MSCVGLTFSVNKSVADLLKFRLCDPWRDGNAYEFAAQL